MELNRAAEIATKAVLELKPYCKKIKIAGSIRRQKPLPNDIEIVCIPDTKQLFKFCEIVNRWRKIKGEPTGKYTQRLLPSGIKLDLFMATFVNWGAILLIRTGDWEFSKKFTGTIMPLHGLRMKDGLVWRGSEIVPVSDEADMFRLVGLEVINPEQREARIL